jgi:hypothetical protein
LVENFVTHFFKRKKRKFAIETLARRRLFSNFERKYCRIFR